MGKLAGPGRAMKAGIGTAAIRLPDGLTVAALMAVNAVGDVIDPATGRPKLALGLGGYSGPALRPIALACVHACSAVVDLPIVGMGGITSGRDVHDFVAAGASAVALGTILFSDPWAPEHVRAEVAESVPREIRLQISKQ